MPKALWRFFNLGEICHLFPIRNIQCPGKGSRQGDKAPFYVSSCSKRVWHEIFDFSFMNQFLQGPWVSHCGPLRIFTKIHGRKARPTTLADPCLLSGPNYVGIRRSYNKLLARQPLSHGRSWVRYSTMRIAERSSKWGVTPSVPKKHLTIPRIRPPPPPGA